MVTKRFPSRLWVLTIQDGSQNSSGDIVEGSQVWINASECREEKKTGTVVNEESGSYHEFSSKIFAPADCPFLKKGTLIEVREGSTVKMAGTVKLYDKTANHCRIWV